MKFQYLVVLLMFVGRQLPPTSFAQNGKGVFNNTQLSGVPVINLSTDATGLTPVDNVTVPSTSAIKTWSTNNFISSTNVITAGTYNTVGVNTKGQVIAGFIATPSAVTRNLNTSYQLSTTQSTRVSYSLTSTVTLSLLVLSGSTSAFLEISPNNATWTTICQAGYSDGILIGGSLAKSVTSNLGGEVPAGYYIRIRTSATGGGAVSYTCGQETPY